MKSLLTFPLKKGDWVQGKTERDELYQGYIENIDVPNDFIQVRVIQSDNTDVIGKLTNNGMNRVKRLDNTPLDQEGYWLNFIDLALMTRDEAWFMELTNSLNALYRQRTSI